MGAQHTKPKSCLFDIRVAHIINALSRNVLVHTHLSARHHVLYCPCELVHFQQEQDLSLEFIEDLDDFSMILGCFFHNLSFVRRRVQIKEISIFIIEFIYSFACKHQEQQFRIGGTKLFCSSFVVFRVIQNESNPKFIVIFDELIIKLLIKSVIQQDKLIFLVFQLPYHQVATMGISVNESFLMNHLYNHLGEQLANLLCVYSHLFQLCHFINVDSIYILHNQHSFCGLQVNLGNIDILKVILPQKLFSSLHVSSLVYEIQFKLQVFLELLYQPFIAEFGEHPKCHIYKYSHHLQIFLGMTCKMPMLDLDCYFLSIQKFGLMHLGNRSR